MTLTKIDEFLWIGEVIKSLTQTANILNATSYFRELDCIKLQTLFEEADKKFNSCFFFHAAQDSQIGLRMKWTADFQ